MAKASENSHYLALHAARSLAAIAVFLDHYKGQIPVFCLIGGSFLAVDLFFLMSGEMGFARVHGRQGSAPLATLSGRLRLRHGAFPG